MIKAVIFDFDHTLYDRDASYAKMLAPFKEELSAYLDHDIEDSELLRRMQQADKDGAYPAGWPDVYQEKIKQGIFKTVPTYEVYMKCIRTHQPRSITLWDDTLDTLTTLRQNGLLLGILTNGSVKNQSDKLNNTPLAPYFDKIVISGSLPEGKPHASAFLAVCHALGVQPCEAMYVGDHPINDVEGSKKAGLVSVWIPYVRPFPASRMAPDYTIEKLGELPALVARINEV